MPSEISIYQVDAFSKELFGGNPAAVCPLTEWLEDGVMQSIAAENNLSETAFLVPEGNCYRLRWFTPKVEVNLCGHATLASGYVVLNLLAPALDRVVFHTLSGTLEVWRDGRARRLAMSLPAADIFPCQISSDVIEELGASPTELFLTPRKGAYLMAVFECEDEIRRLTPDLARVSERCDGLVVTAPSDSGAEYDVVSRYFAPSKGVPEDPVTGSAHCQIIPYWAKRLGRAELTAYQASARGGFLYCTDAGDRVILRGDCALYMQGKIFL